MIGGGGERKTLRIVAESRRHVERLRARPTTLVHKDEVLRAHCADVGRDPAAIERTVGCKITIRVDRGRGRARPAACSSTTGRRSSGSRATHTFWTGTPEQIAETMLAYRRVGFHTFIVELPAPYDVETMETLATVVKPMVTREAR